MLSIILSVFPKCRPVHIQATLVISYYSHIVIEGTTPGVGWGKELLLSVEDGVHPNPIAHGLAQTAHDPLHIDEYIQKFKELATLLAYPEDHQVQIFKMMMPENIELRIKDMTTLNQCIDEAKACLTIC